MLPYFIFNNISSADFDYINVKKLPPISQPQKNIDFYESKSRNGHLTRDYDTYKSTIKNIEITLEENANFDYLRTWLQGTGDILFSTEPDRTYKATIMNKFDFERLWNSGIRQFIIQLKCQPFGDMLSSTDIELIEQGSVYNTATAESKPVIKVYGSGNIDLTINSKTINLTNVIDDITIDSVLEDAYNDTQLLNNNMSGEFPVFTIGENTISWTGTVTKLVVTPNFKSLG